MSLCQKLTCEGVGTFGLTLTVVMVNGTAPTMTVFAVGMYLACFAYAFGSISGTHINPAVSVGVFTWGIINKTASALEFALYILIQYVGNYWNIISVFFTFKRLPVLKKNQKNHFLI